MLQGHSITSSLSNAKRCVSVAVQLGDKSIILRQIGMKLQVEEVSIAQTGIRTQRTSVDDPPHVQSVVFGRSATLPRLLRPGPKPTSYFFFFFFCVRQATRQIFSPRDAV